MAGSITSLGVGSGLDLESLVQNLVAAEARPIQLLESRKVDLDLKISGFGQIQSALSEFQAAVSALNTPEAFRGVSATSSDDSIFSASASQSAVTGSNVVEVTQLAQNNKFGTQSFTNEDEIIGTGELSFTVAGETFTVAITSENNTLAQIRDAINAESGNSTVQASIINVDEGSKLILTANESGIANQIAFTVTDDDANNSDDAGLSQLVFGIQELDEARDATLIVDGFAVTRSSNEIDDVIQGITLSLESLGTATVTASENLGVAKTTIEALVTSYNSLASALQVQGDSTLSGENTILNIESRVRGLFSNKYNDSTANINYLFQLGLSFDRDGILSFDGDEFDTQVGNNIGEIQSLFTNTESGFITQLEDLIESYTESDGILSNRTEGLNTEKTTIDSDIERLELRLESTEARLRERFGALDTLVSQLNATSSFLTQQLANLPLTNQSS